MWFFKKKTSPRRTHLRKSIAAERLSQFIGLINTDLVSIIMIWLLFTVLSGLVLTFELITSSKQIELISLFVIVAMVTASVVTYIRHFQMRIIKNRTRAFALIGLFVILLLTAKLGVILTDHVAWATGTSVTIAIILTIAYSQRFAIGMSAFYIILATFAAGPKPDINLLLIMASGMVTCCFSLREIRTRVKLLEVSVMAGVVVFVTALALDLLSGNRVMARIFKDAGLHAGITIAVGMLIQSLLPLIEKVFRIATSMTLLDYSDANQPLLKRLAMETPGTYSHSLLIGSIAEAAAESISRNGLLCRVGAYYHDIGKINKPDYFVENEMGSASRHTELSPAMSQLVIVGHVKDGIEIAKEYSLPNVLRQFIETHHGTTLIEYFYNEARKKHDEKQSSADTKKGAPSSPPPAEIEFRYPGPKPRTKEAAIVMLADTVEGAVRSLKDLTPTRIEVVVHNMSMKRLQDGQFDECDLTLRELSQIESSITKTLAAHYHSRIAYPKSPEVPDDGSWPDDNERKSSSNEQKKASVSQVEQKN